MIHVPRNRLLGPAILLATALLVTACNSGSGTSPNSARQGNSVTGTESPSQGKTSAKGTIAEALAGKVNGTR